MVGEANVGSRTCLLHTVSSNACFARALQGFLASFLKGRKQDVAPLSSFMAYSKVSFSNAYSESTGQVFLSERGSAGMSGIFDGCRHMKVANPLNGRCISFLH